MVKLNREFWALPVFAGTALAIAAWQDASVLWFLTYTCLACMAVAMLYRWRNWRGVKISRSFSRTILEAGEGLHITLLAGTTGRLPWPWLGMRDSLPRAVAQRVEEAGTVPGGDLVWMGPNKMGSVYYTIENIPRGIHKWDSIELHSGDPFGLVSYKGISRDKAQVIVYPRTVPLDAWKFFPMRGDGNASAKNSLNHDLSQLVGVREYRPGDRLSLIHWKSAARTSQLHSKEFSPIHTESSLVILDCSAQSWHNPNDFEEAVSIAASLVKSAWQKKIPVRFHGNQGTEPEALNISTQAAYNNALIHFATIGATGWQPLNKVLIDEFYTQGSNVVVVAPSAGPKLLQTLFRLSSRGNIVTLIQVDAEPNQDRHRPRSAGTFNLFTVAKADELTVWLGKGALRS